MKVDLTPSDGRKRKLSLEKVAEIRYGGREDSLRKAATRLGVKYRYVKSIEDYDVWKDSV
jgi:hypothetical protein